jgi:hypothetical protein
LIMESEADKDLVNIVGKCRKHLQCEPGSTEWSANVNAYSAGGLRECLTNLMVSAPPETKSDLKDTLNAFNRLRLSASAMKHGFTMAEHILQTCQKEGTRKLLLNCHSHLLKANP